MKDPDVPESGRAAAVPSSVRERFSRGVTEVERMFRENPEFREVCLDYDECVQALARFAAASSVADPRSQDYRQLVEDLAREIRCQLGAEAG
jgi:hypothetical protein